VRRARNVLRDLISVANQDRAKLLDRELALFERAAARAALSPP
jgi:hypothetical protein